MIYPMDQEFQPRSPEFARKEIGGAIELVSNPEGWSTDQIEFHLNPNLFLSGNPDKSPQTPESLRGALQAAWQKTKEVREPAGDFDAPKVTVRRVEVVEGKLVAYTALTDYFTLWGIPQAAPEIYQRFLSEMPKSHETEVPNGISTQNILLTRDGEVVFLVRSRGTGFYGGRLSLSLDEQMDPHVDMTPHNAAYRGYWEELGLFIPHQNIKCLGVAAEKGAAYTSWCFVAVTDKDAESIRKSWKKAKDYNENGALLIVPLHELDEWIKEPLSEVKIEPEIWRPKDVEGRIDPKSVLQVHPTVPWRANLLKKFIGIV